MNKAAEQELKVADFVNEHPTESEATPVEVKAEKKQIKMIEKFKSLKTWQKVTIVTAACVGLGFGGKVIYDVVTKQPEAVADVVEAVAENAAEAGLEVKTF